MNKYIIGCLLMFAGYTAYAGTSADNKFILNDQMGGPGRTSKTRNIGGSTR